MHVEGRNIRSDWFVNIIFSILFYKVKNIAVSK